MDRSFTPKIADFGLSSQRQHTAKVEEEGEGASPPEASSPPVHATQNIGTPMWMAPGM